MSFLRRVFFAFISVLSGLPAFAASVSSFQPTLGSVGDAVTIMGSGFFPSGAPGSLIVRFNGIQDLTAAVTAADGTIIQAQVPPGTPLGPGPISVQINGGTPAASLQDFLVIGPGPYITGFSPAQGGNALQVFIDGVHFSSANVTNAYFNGRVGVNFFVQSDIRISVTTPSGITTGPVSVRSPLGTNTTSTNFFVPPVITSFAPTNGRAGTNVLILGTNFIGALSVRFGGVFAPNFNVLSNNAISVTVPTNAVTGQVRVDAPAGSALSSSNYVIQPTIFGFSPAFGPQGTSVILTGANFTNATTPNPTVRFNGVVATVTNVSFGQLTAIVPATTSGPITLMTSDGTAVSPTLFYLPASISSFTPSNGPPGTIVRINGINFSNASAVSFNGTPAVNFFVTNNTTIGAIVPFDVLTGPISVTTPAGTTNSSGFFYGVPGISLFAPTHGLPGTNITLTGSNFLGATAVLFNGVAATNFFVTNNTTIGVRVPAGAQTGPITVIAPGGTNTTAQNFVLDYTSDLVVKLTDNPDPVLVGSNLVYFIGITNNGPFVATNIIWSNLLPASVTLKTATVSHGTLNTNGNPIQGTISSLAIGAGAGVTLTVAPQAVGTITNSASASNLYTDPAISNNTVEVTTTVLPLPLLSIRTTSTNRLRLSWPLALSNYVLESKPTLGTNTSWSNVTNLPITVGDEKVVIETNNSPSRFYRLRS